MSEFTYKPLGPISEYAVTHDGEAIGTVRKWERRYNLRRVIVSRGWRARTPDGERLYHADGTTADTREGAAQALLLRFRARES